VGGHWTLNPVKKMTVTAAYTALFAPEDTPTRTGSPALFSGDGNFRGHSTQGVIKHQFNKRLSGHLWCEFIWQGDYYAQRDLMSFLRGEIMFSF
jgi:hypothetical protein